MATTENADGDMDASTAREFAEKRLEESADGETFSPSELAEEYGCGNGHMRHCLRDLLEEGIVERVARGEYAHGDAEIETDLDTESSDDEDRFTAPVVDTDDAEDEDPSRSDGEARSEDRDTEDTDGDDGLSSTSETVGAAAAAGGASVLAVDDWETQKWMLLGLAVGAVVFLWWRSRSSGDQVDGQEEIDERDQQDDDGGPTYQAPVGGD